MAISTASSIFSCLFPVNSKAFSPLTKRITNGIPWTSYFSANSGFSSTSTEIKLNLLSWHIFLSCGFNALQGPHHEALKSTKVGVSFFSSKIFAKSSPSSSLNSISTILYK